MQERARQLLRQLVHAPSSMSRNRHFFVFQDPMMADIRRRAAHLRTIRDALLQDEAQIVRYQWKNNRLMLRLRYHNDVVQRAWLQSEEVKILIDALWSEASDALRDIMAAWRHETSRNHA